MTLYKYLVHLQTRSYLEIRKVMTAKQNSEENLRGLNPTKDLQTTEQSGKCER